MLQSMIADDIEKGRTVFVMDSQRDMIQKLARLNHDMETILIDPEDTEFPPAIALFDIKTGDEVEENTLIELYQYVFTQILSAGLTLRQDVLFTYVLRLAFSLPEANLSTLFDIFKNGEDYQRRWGNSTRWSTTFSATSISQNITTPTRREYSKASWHPKE